MIDRAMEPHKTSFARRLRDLRETKGYGAARHFAKALGIPENRYTRYERGAAEPNIDLIYQICRTLDVSPDELFNFHKDARTPGFSGGPQAPLEPETPAGSATSGDGDARSQAVGALTGAGARADAAAWQLASAVARMRSDRLPSSARTPLGVLGDTSRTFLALRRSPYEAIAQITIELGVERLPEPAATELTDLIEQFIASIAEHN